MDHSATLVHTSKCGEDLFVLRISSELQICLFESLKAQDPEVIKVDSALHKVLPSCPDLGNACRSFQHVSTCTDHGRNMENSDWQRALKRLESEFVKHCFLTDWTHSTFFEDAFFPK